MESRKRKISILGSTGSIGTQALEVIEKLSDKFEVVALACGHNTKLLEEQAKKFRPEYICLSDASAKLEIPGIKTLYGEEGLEEICSNKENDIILVAVSGKIGLKPTLKAIENKIPVALANKETLVMAGDIVMRKAKENNVDIIPVDSEHCAIHQCIKNIAQVEKLIITASGGPFLHKTTVEMQDASISDVLAHPRWNMGRKITVDSATLMNKGLEVIEAHHLFSMDYDKIDVLMHKESIIHSLVQFQDGAILAQIGDADMRLPIQFALSEGRRLKNETHFDFMDIPLLHFGCADTERFPLLAAAYECGRKEGNACAILNAANETAVYAFLNEQISFLQIEDCIFEALKEIEYIEDATIEDILLTDKKTREFVNQYVKGGI